ncbi:DAK2 domain-containing protein [uncultured Roseobacter sp.]|uniref:DAK2 domain-containing protein n=1 Tax=uncultured Roseobacter sp. TaxID=114847 RepID=UPI00261EFC25|nr:DAK2 domain-containing protein [uncultured Roseobacter sp.]
MKDFLALCVTRFEALEQELNQLDAATGDGDHGATILKGLRAAAAFDDAPEKAFRKAAGGASGSLFAQIIAALDRAADGAPLGAALSQAADRIAMLGQAKPGDKTMLDALIPAAAATSPDEAAQAAAAGRDATRDMPAKRGRARYVEGAGVGHVDAGATSVAALLAIFAEWRRM